MAVPSFTLIFSRVKSAVRKTMQGNKSKGTIPELTLRKALWAAGLRGYRTNVKNLPGKPDIVFGRAKIAIFVHGCFWHSCPACYDRRWREPKTNQAYWLSKLAGNKDRDEKNVATLESLGYRVLIVWECEIKSQLSESVEFIRFALTQRSPG